jgi:hypothetical protein
MKKKLLILFSIIYTGTNENKNFLLKHIPVRYLNLFTFLTFNLDLEKCQICFNKRPIFLGSGSITLIFSA